MSNPPPHRIGLALGSGSARGWAHIGVIRGLREAGIDPNIVCGTSIGALVGAAYANNDLDRLAQWVKGLTWQAVVGFLDFSLNGGMIKGQKLVDFFRHNFVDLEIPRLPRPFAAVTTDLGNGRELWLRDGLVSDAVRASIALPGRHLRNKSARADNNTDKGESIAEVVFSRLQAGMASLNISPPGEKKGLPSLLDTLASSLNIMQVRITRSRLAGEPADVLVTPRLAHLGLMDFHRAHAAIDAGRQAVAHALPQLHLLMHEET